MRSCRLFHTYRLFHRYRPTISGGFCVVCIRLLPSQYIGSRGNRRRGSRQRCAPNARTPLNQSELPRACISRALWYIFIAVPTKSILGAFSLEIEGCGILGGGGNPAPLREYLPTGAEMPPQATGTGGSVSGYHRCAACRLSGAWRAKSKPRRKGGGVCCYPCFLAAAISTIIGISNIIIIVVTLARPPRRQVLPLPGGYMSTHCNNRTPRK